MSTRLLFGYTTLILVAIVLAGIFGAAVRLITQETPSGPEVKTDARQYVVKRGDALGRISRKTGVPEERLMELNPTLDPLALVPGTRINLRPPTDAERERARKRRDRPKPKHYVVKAGDSPSAIAEKTGVPLDRLYRLNRGIEEKPLVPGQRLTLRR